MKGIRLIVFDLDGTLVDAYPAITSSFNYAMRRLGYPARSDSVIRSAVGWGDENLLRPFIKPEDLRTGVSLYRKHHKSALTGESRLFPRADKVLSYLKHKGYLLAVASNRPTSFSLILMRHLKIRDYFDYVLCADKLSHIKPHPEILKKIMRKFSLGPEETLYVGDMTIDARAGRAAKVKTVIVTTGSSSKIEIKKERPYRIIYSIKQLLNVL